MLKNIRQTDIELLENIRENGCLFLCFAEVSPLVFVEKNGRKALNKIWKEAVKKGYISEDDIILMTVHGETKAYKPIEESDGSWDMVYSDTGIYGLSCENIDELRAMLLADYATGIITNVVLNNKCKEK